MGRLVRLSWWAWCASEAFSSCRRACQDSEFVEQGVEVLAQLAQLGDAGFRYALLEIPFAAHGMRDLRQLVERADDTAYQPPRQVEGAQGGKQQAQDHAGETGEQEAQQAAAGALHLHRTDLLAVAGSVVRSAR